MERVGLGDDGMIKKIVMLLLCFIMILSMCACGTEAENDNAKESVRENQYIVSINPQALIRENADTGEIFGVDALNQDAERYYENLDVSEKKLSDVVNEMVDICVSNDLINENNKNVNIIVTRYLNQDESEYNQELDKIQQNIEDKYQNQVILVETKAENYQTPQDPVEGNADNESEKIPEEIWIDCPECEGGHIECPFCHGDWEHGEYVDVDVDCDNCEGGKIITTETVSVYNGTPCKICGDVGTVDDGMHGGKRAECGECRGYGARHAVGDLEDAGGYNGVYSGYAFDEVERETEEDCPQCGGEGVFHEQTQEACTNCSYGKAVCPICDGKGGWRTNE